VIALCPLVPPICIILGAYLVLLVIHFPGLPVLSKGYCNGNIKIQKKKKQLKLLPSSPVDFFIVSNMQFHTLASVKTICLCPFYYLGHDGLNLCDLQITQNTHI